MSSATQCRHFVQNAWKKELCSNCFKSREEHATLNQEHHQRQIVAKTTNSVKRVAHKVQGILRSKEARAKRKNVVFPDTLTEIIGYDGGDFYGSDDEHPDDQPDSCSEIDDLPDSEEERALGNLTRANTNFNTVTANLTGTIEEAKAASSRSFNTLRLGRAPKDGDGKKPALLVTVTPFGGDDSVPTARRLVEKKSSPNSTKPKPVSVDESPKPIAEFIPKATVSKKPVEETKSIESPKTVPAPAAIVDMPLITSTNLLSVISPTTTEQQRRTTSIARTPAIKKPENEKPRIVAQDQNAARNQKNLEMSNGVELKLNPVRTKHDNDKDNSKFAKEIPNYTTDKPRPALTDLTERKVEGEAASEKYRPYEQSRESAGEPDGKADEEVLTEPPALPSSPPPAMESSAKRTSFLHGMTEKPKVPQKPVSLPTKVVGSSLASLLSENRLYEYRLSQMQRSAALSHSQSESQLCAIESGAKVSVDSCSESTSDKTEEKDEQVEEEIEGEEDEDDSESSTDAPRSFSKRRMAPQPPNPSEDTSLNLFTRNPASKQSDCPVVREKEKRERASSCSPKFRKGEVTESTAANRPPEPAPRRNISLSQDSLAMAANSERVVEEKKKNRSKFSLKKFLRMGSKKDVDMTCGSKSDEIPSTPQPKPRLEIIHPLELDGAAVQVVRNDKNANGGEDTTELKSDAPGSSSPIIHNTPPHVTIRPSKPPPPPRSQSLDESSSRIQQQQQQQNSGKPLNGKSWQPNGNSGNNDSIYANLGAIRSGLAPAKPRRTSSMRDQQQLAVVSGQTQEQSSAQLSSRSGIHSNPMQRNAIDWPKILPLDFSLSSDDRTFEVDDTNAELRQGVNHPSKYPLSKRQSDSGTLDSNASSELRFQQTFFARSTSLPYCATESELEAYSPFSYHGDKKVTEDGKKDEDARIGRLRQRRGRSIVHHSLEDNYGAVIVANHEALAQFLEQTNQAPAVPQSLRFLKTINLQLRSFSIDRSTAVTTGRRLFFSAVWNEQNNVTLCLAFDSSMRVAQKEFYLAPIVEFIDTVPKDILDLGQNIAKKSAEATISVLPRLQINTLKSFAESVTVENSNDENATRESSFILLQLVNALKSLQAQGIEDAPKDLNNIVLCREDKDAYHRLYVFQRLSIDSCENDNVEYTSLCQCAFYALDQLNLSKKLPLIRELLMREKAVTLSQVKSVLEFSLWGPSDATLGGPRERETALQRWLDLERATVLHALVRARAQLSVTDEYQLLFLVRTSAKIMCEASLLLDRQRNGFLTRGS
ncbi:uncharacterized protein LOC131669361 isoform X2 [Phymastichus coffea]|uniref:uncharacterized protein LOC131669361 isoform X2 n=1 Tax=Phymastichus coffea TaxID=108790 RepID=UPI00273B3C7F|nr:uncharacterized protein LOC131669361 isoform X2 [Phymastichus coffea]